MKSSYVPIDKKHLLSSDVLAVAKYLLGKYIVSKIDNTFCVAKIVETEAYRGEDDKASHAYTLKKTDRTKTMFLEAGVCYVYLCYGIHHMFNIVTGNEGVPNAVLIRAAEPIEGMDIMELRRSTSHINFANGPGKLCKALAIDRSHNAHPICDSSADIFIADNKTIPDKEIISGPRVGIAYAEECAQWPWRFRIKDNIYTSKPDNPSYP